MAARTLLQQAVPTTFGYKAAGWLVGLVHARTQAGALELPAQLGGAAGTQAALGDDGPEVLRLYALEFGLREPTAAVAHDPPRRSPISPARSRALPGWSRRSARDVVLLAQTEVAEVSEADGGASSTMPHKRNPTSAILAARALGTCARTQACSFESAVQSTSVRSVPGMRSGTR